MWSQGRDGLPQDTPCEIHDSLDQSGEWPAWWWPSGGFPWSGWAGRDRWGLRGEGGIKETADLAVAATVGAADQPTVATGPTTACLFSAFPWVTLGGCRENAWT